MQEMHQIHTNVKGKIAFKKVKPGESVLKSFKVTRTTADTFVNAESCIASFFLLMEKSVGLID